MFTNVLIGFATLMVALPIMDILYQGKKATR